MRTTNFEKSLNLPKILLECAGMQIFPKEDDVGVVHLLKSWIFYFYASWLGPVVLGEFCWLVDAVYTGQSFEDLCTSAPCLTISILAIIKFNCLYFNRNIVKNIVEKLKSMHPKNDEEELSVEIKERLIIKNALKFLGTVMMFFSYSSVVVVLVFGTASALAMVYDYISMGTSEFKFPFRIKYFFEVSTLGQWALVYLHQVVAMLMVCVDLLSVDLLFYSFCTYLQMHFRLLCLQFEDVVSRDSKVKTRENLRKAVTRHQELIELVEQIELLYSKSTLCNIILSSLLICLSGFIVTFQVSTGTMERYCFKTAQFIHDVGAVSSFVTFLVMNLSQISLLCFFGDMLNSASTRVSQAIYNSIWYDAEPHVKESVLIVIIRAQKPCKLTAMKFADLNLNALGAILRTSWSYFALLKTMFN